MGLKGQAAVSSQTPLPESDYVPREYIQPPSQITPGPQSFSDFDWQDLTVPLSTGVGSTATPLQHLQSHNNPFNINPSTSSTFDTDYLNHLYPPADQYYQNYQDDDDDESATESSGQNRHAAEEEEDNLPTQESWFNQNLYPLHGQVPAGQELSAQDFPPAHAQAPLQPLSHFTPSTQPSQSFHAQPYPRSFSTDSQSQLPTSSALVPQMSTSLNAGSSGSGAQSGNKDWLDVLQQRLLPDFFTVSTNILFYFNLGYNYCSYQTGPIP